MSCSSSAKQPVSGKPPSGSDAVLLFGYAKLPLQEREKVLREVGFSVRTASSFRSAIAQIHKSRAKFRFLIIGHMVPEKERTGLSRAFKEACPKGKVIVFYRGSVKNASTATALLSTTGSPEVLLETIFGLS